jgi:hypothetical protein
MWEACLSAASILADIGAAEAPGEDFVPDRELVTVVIAAAMHQQLHRRGLDYDIQAVRVVELLGDNGLAATLRLAAYSALEEAPDVPGVGGEQREQLLADGAAGQHPDARLRWEQVRAAAADAVQASGRLGAEVARLPVLLADVLDAERIRRLQDFYGTDDYN